MNARRYAGFGIVLVVVLLVSILPTVGAEEAPVARAIVYNSSEGRVESDAFFTTAEEALASGYTEITFLQDVSLPEGTMIGGSLRTENGAVVTFESDVLISGDVFGDVRTEHGVFIYGQCYGRVEGGKRYHAVYCIPNEGGSVAFESDRGTVDVGIGVPFVEYGSQITFTAQPNEGYQAQSVACDKFKTPIQSAYTVCCSAAYWGNFLPAE